MASDSELILSISADTAQLRRAMARLQSDSARSAKAIESNFAKAGANIESRIKGLAAGFAGGLGAGIASGFSIDALVKFTDASTRITNALKVAGLEGENLAATYDRLGKIALANGANFESLAVLYGRVTQSSTALGISAAQVEEFTRRMAVGLRASGTDAQAASQGIRQLTQGLASGVLRGDEFNSVMENLPPVAKAVAAGLGDIDLGKLREMAEAGELTAEVFYGAFMKGSAGLDAQAAKTAMTFSQAFENIATALTIAAGEFNEATGAAQGFSNAVNNLVIPSIITLGERFRSNQADIKSWGEALEAAGGGAIGDAIRELIPALGDLDAALGGEDNITRKYESASKAVHQLAGDITRATAGIANSGLSTAAADQARAALERVAASAEDGRTAAEKFRAELASEFPTGAVDKLVKIFERVEAGAEDGIVSAERLRAELSKVLPGAAVDNVIAAYERVTASSEGGVVSVKALRDELTTGLPEGALAKAAAALDRVAKRAENGLIKTADFLAELKRLDNAGAHADHLSESFETLERRIESGFVAAEDFNKVIDELNEAGASELADDVAEARDRYLEAAKAAGTVEAATQKIVDKITAALNPAFQKTLEILRDIPGTLREISGIVEGMPAAEWAKKFGPGNLTDAQKDAAGAVSGTAATAKAFLKTRAATTEVGETFKDFDDEFARALAKLMAILPDTARIRSGVRSYEEQARIRARHEAMPGGVAAHPAARPGHSKHETGTAADISEGVSMEALRAAVKLIPELEQLDAVSEALYQKDKVHVQLAGEAARQEKDIVDQKIQSEKELAEASERRIEQQTEARAKLEEMLTTSQQELELAQQINAINADLTLSEDERAMAIMRVTAEAAKAAEVETLLNQAREAGLAITPELIAQYEALATAKVNAAMADQQLAIAQRDATDRSEDHARAMQEFGDAVAGIAQGAISGFISDLRAGKSAGEAFANMLNRIIDGLINMALEALFSKQMLGGLFGGIGGGGGALPAFGTVAYHKGGVVGRDGVKDGRKFSPALWANAPRYATGGVAGLKPGEIPAILHRGELVIPTSALNGGGRQSKAGDVYTTLGDVKIDMSKTGLVAADNDRAKSFATNVQRLIQLEMVRESRPGGLLRRVPA